MEGGRQLYILMNGDEYQCELYRINDTQSDTGHEESSIACLGDPLFRMGKPTFPEFMSFAAINSRIYMVGGSVKIDSGEYLASNKVFIYDTTSSTWISGPSMNAGKQFPYLITLGSKLFALSTLMNFWGVDNSELEGNPRFEMLDTENLGRGWSPLPIPPLDASKKRDGPFAYAATNGFIFASIGRSGTWAFDLKEVEWNKISDDSLPFSGQAVAMPNVRDLCCGYSSKIDGYCAFRFCYQTDNKEFAIDEIPIDDSYTLTPLAPPLVCCSACPIVFGPGGGVYFVNSGVDEPETYDSVAGNRYVQVYCLELNQNETTKVDSILRRCSQTPATSSNFDGIKEIKLKGVWSRSFFGGPAVDPYLQVVAAFVI